MHTKAEAAEVNEFARSVFIKDGYHTPIVILYKGNEQVVLPVQEMMKSGVTKDMLAFLIRKSIKELEFSGVVMIMEAWMHLCDKATNPEIIQQLNSGEKHVRDLEDKQEVLMLRAESDDGLNVTFSNPIYRDKDGKPTLKEVEVMDITTKGRFGGFFAD